MQVRIRPLQLNDADKSWRLRSNPNLKWEFMKCDPPLPASLEKERKRFKEILEDRRTAMFAILADETIVGFCSLKNIANGAAELSYVILDMNMRGKGIGTEAVNQLISYGFDELGLDLIYRYVDRRNTPSIRMTATQRFAAIGISYLNQNVERFEMTRTGWMNLRNRRSKRSV